MPHTFYVNKAALPKKAIENNRKNECRTAKKVNKRKILKPRSTPVSTPSSI
jgi:hypothetical protein